MVSAIETLVELQRILRELAATQRTYAQPPDETLALATQRDALIEARELNASVRAEAEVARRAAEGEAEQLRAKVARFEEQISQVATQREYGALLKEIDTAKQHIAEHEDAVLAAMTAIEDANSAEATSAEELVEIEARHSEQHATWEGSRPKLAATREALEGRRAELRASLSPGTLRLFEKLLERHDGDPMAGVVRVERPASTNAMFRCSVCNYSVRPQVVVQISGTDDIVICDCGRQRIFFLAEDQG